MVRLPIESWRITRTIRSILVVKWQLIG